MERPIMRLLSFGGALAILASMLEVRAQTPSAVGSDPLAASSSPGLIKSAACEASTQEPNGQSKREQLQLCLAKARIDCLKQAVDQKVYGKQRADFVKSCMGEQPTN